jgi:radical SAM protein with 4Fe4S-binding SPASM domain
VRFDGVTQESYASYCQGGDIGNVIENVKRIVDAKYKAKSILPFIKLQFLVHRYNEKEIETAKRMAVDLNVEIEFKSLMFNAKNKKLREKWEPQDKKFIRYDFKSDRDINYKQYMCNWLWRYAVVNWDGTVTPCCNWLENGTFEFGNLKTQSFKEIWNNEYFVAARKAMAGEISLSITACHSCLGIPPAIDEGERRGDPE